MIGVSIIICCYNSATRIAETLRHISLQRFTSDILCEVILVDNNCTDNTLSVSKSEWLKFKSHRINFRIVTEIKPGLSNAREKGVSSALYEYLIFCDDDNWLCEIYVETAFNLLNNHKNVGVIGGWGFPHPEVNPPKWFDDYEQYYATGAQSENNGVMKSLSPYIYGAGAVIRKACLQQLENIDFKPLAIDRLKNSLSSGGDVELCYAITLIGYEIMYHNDLKFQHFIQKNRLTEKYIKELAYQMGYCNTLHRPYYWIFQKNIENYKKNSLWVIIIGITLYLHSFFKLVKSKPSNKFRNRVNIEHAKGRLFAAVSLNLKVDKSYSIIRNKFRL